MAIVLSVNKLRRRKHLSSSASAACGFETGHQIPKDDAVQFDHIQCICHGWCKRARQYCSDV